MVAALAEPGRAMAAAAMAKREWNRFKGWCWDGCRVDCLREMRKWRIKKLWEGKYYCSGVSGWG